jgi:hypothetical protein
VEAAVRSDGSFDLQLLQPGTRVDVTGLLTAVGGGRWRLMPRSQDDISLGFPSVTVSEARALAVGQTVIVTGTALNARTAFTDTTVHVLDATGSIRMTRVRPTVLAGDRARFIGTTARRDGQPVLDNVTPLVLDVGGLPAPIRLSSALAATASNGTLDAAQAQVREVNVISTVTSGSELILTVNDGSGPLEVRVRTDIGINLGPLVPGAVVNLTGLLVPHSTTPASWRLRVRTGADITVIS